MVIIHERDGRVIVSHVSASAIRPAVTHEEITNAAEIAVAIAAKEQPPAPIIETVIDMLAETEQEFEARMVAALVDTGARHIIVDTVDLPSPPPERWVVNWTTGAITLGGPSKADLAAYAAEKRWRVETGGCSWSGHTVQTDRDSQSKLIAEFVALGAGLRTDPSPWKFADGFALVSNADMAAVIGAARAHVATAFATEAGVLAAIEAGTITTFAAVDLAFA